MLCLVRHVLPLEVRANEGLINAVQTRLGGRIDEHPIDDVCEVIAGLAVDGPTGRQALERRGDLLDNEVNGQVALLSSNAEVRLRGRAARRVRDPAL